MLYFDKSIKKNMPSEMKVKFSEKNKILSAKMVVLNWGIGGGIPFPLDPLLQPLLRVLASRFKITP